MHLPDQVDIYCIRNFTRPRPLLESAHDHHAAALGQALAGASYPRRPETATRNMARAMPLSGCIGWHEWTLKRSEDEQPLRSAGRAYEGGLTPP
jgi:hypothetical protein